MTFHLGGNCNKTGVWALGIDDEGCAFVAFKIPNDARPGCHVHFNSFTGAPLSAADERAYLPLYNEEHALEALSLVTCGLNTVTQHLTLVGDIITC